MSKLIAPAYEALFGLRVPEWRLIAVLAEREAGTQQALGRGTRMDKVTVSRATAALATRGLVERAPSTKDGRSHIVRLSPAGWRLYREVVPQALDIEARIFGDFSSAEREMLLNLLARVDEAATTFQLILAQDTEAEMTKAMSSRAENLRGTAKDIER